MRIHQCQQRDQSSLRADVSYFLQPVACEQALQGDLAAGREKEGELATTSLELEYLNRKFRCKMLIGGLVMTSSVYAKRTKQTPNATYKTTSLKFLELKLPTSKRNRY